MLSQERRLRTTDITRLFARSNTQKVAVYPFVYFIGPRSNKKKNNTSHRIQRGIQLPNKIVKTSVQRHLLKRLFYDSIEQIVFDERGECILAVPQKNRSIVLTQILATDTKTDITKQQKQLFIKSLSLLSKQSWNLDNGGKK